MDKKETENAPPLQFPARLDAIPGAMTFAAMALRQAGLAPGMVARAELILEELLRNSILHGYGGDSAQSVWVGVCGRVLCYEDAAPPFNPLADGPPAPDPALPLEQRAVGGVGLALIRQLGGAIAYSHAGGHNRIEITLQQG